MDTVHAEIEDEFDLLDTEGHPLKKALAVVLGLAGLAGLAFAHRVLRLPSPLDSNS